MKKIHLHTTEGVTYSLVEAIGGTRLVPLFYKHMAELMEAGHCLFTTFNQPTNKSQGIIAEIDNKIVGFLLFHKKPESMSGIFGYVDPNYRQRSIFALIMKCWYAYAKDSKSRYVEGYVSAKNEISIHAHNTLGFSLFFDENFKIYKYVRAID